METASSADRIAFETSAHGVSLPVEAVSCLTEAAVSSGLEAGIAMPCTALETASSADRIAFKTSAHGVPLPVKAVSCLTEAAISSELEAG